MCTIVDTRHDDETLVWRLANGDGAALEPLMDRWGDPIIDTCLRALRDAERVVDLCGEVWAEIYFRVRAGTEPLPRAFGPWAAGVIGELVTSAPGEGRIPIPARLRMRLLTTAATTAELARLATLSDPGPLRAASEELPRDFSAAADRMLLNMPEPTALSRIHIPNGTPAR